MNTNPSMKRSHRVNSKQGELPSETPPSPIPPTGRTSPIRRPATTYPFLSAPARPPTLGRLLWATAIALVCLWGLSSSRAGTVEYTRDAAGRLLGVRYGSSQVLMHTYDAAGNLRRLGPPSAGTDTDQDGLDDTWETQFFGNLARDGTGDFDRDGSSDLSEFLAGTNPGDPASALLLFREVVNGEGTTLVRWHSVAGRTYRLQYRDQLDTGNWEDISGDVVASGTVAEKSESLPATGHRFYRVVLISTR